MSKATDDLIDRITGTTTALGGMKVKLSPQPQSVQVEVPPAPMTPATQEDYAQVKKLAEQLKNEAEALEAEVNKESKVPDTAQAGAVETKSEKGAEHKK